MKIKNNPPSFCARVLCWLACAALAASGAWGVVRLPSIYSDNMVIQAGKPVVVRGWAAPGETVKVEFLGGKASVVAGADRRWRAELPAQAAGGAYEMTVTGETNSLRIRNILVGDVWLGAGGDDMALSLKDTPDGSAQAQSARCGEIRFFRVCDRLLAEAKDDIDGRWEVCAPESAAEFSALLYYFGRDIYQARKQPVGLIAATVSNTPVAAWVARDELEKTPTGRAVLARFEERLGDYDVLYARYQKAMKGSSAAEVGGESAGTRPRAPMKPDDPSGPANARNGLIAPFAGYPVEGIIFAAGARDAREKFSREYAVLQRLMIGDLRACWNAPDLPVYLLELPSISAKGADAVRLGQAAAVAGDAHAALVPAADLGGKDAAPSFAQAAAARLSQQALAPFAPVTPRAEVVAAAIRSGALLPPESPDGQPFAPRPRPECLPVTLPESVTLAGIPVSLKTLPADLTLNARLGVLTAKGVQASLFHYVCGARADAVRAVKLPNGEYLAVVVSGTGTSNGQGHYGPPKFDYRKKENILMAYRSKDKGLTWTREGELFPVEYSLHGFIPLVPKGTSRLYCFGTEPVPELRAGRENAPIAFRHSDDNGRTWSEPQIIRPENDPDFKGMSCMQMAETSDGSWLLGSHDAHWEPGGEKLKTWIHKKFGLIRTRQYLLRSTDKGKTWTLLPAARPDGWCLPEYNRMEEGRPIALPDGRALLLTRTAEGHLWYSKSNDNGATWSPFKSTGLVHPDAPPMIFTLNGGKTLAVFHHNNYDPAAPHMNGAMRNQLWVSFSNDEGDTWSEPRFVMAVANDEPGVQCSYIDMLEDGGRLFVFVPYGWRQTVLLRLSLAELFDLPTQSQIRAAAAVRP